MVFKGFFKKKVKDNGKNTKPINHDFASFKERSKNFTTDIVRDVLKRYHGVSSVIVRGKDELLIKKLAELFREEGLEVEEKTLGIRDYIVSFEFDGIQHNLAYREEQIRNYLDSIKRPLIVSRESFRSNLENAKYLILVEDDETLRKMIKLSFSYLFKNLKVITASSKDEFEKNLDKIKQEIEKNNGNPNKDLVIILDNIFPESSKTPKKSEIGINLYWDLMKITNNVYMHSGSIREKFPLMKFIDKSELNNLLY